MRRLIRLTCILLVLSTLTACTGKVTDSSFTTKKQDVPEGFGTDLIAQTQSNDLRNEIYEEDGKRYYKAGMYGFVIREEAKTLFIDRVIEKSIAQHIGIIPEDEIISINGNKSINLVADGFVSLEDSFVYSSTITFELKRKGQMMNVRILPPINYDFDADRTTERLYYYSLDNPFISELLVYDSITGELRENFNIFRELALVNDIESLTLDYFNRQSFIDRTSDGFPELLLTFQYPQANNLSQIILLTHKNDAFSVVEYVDQSGVRRPVAFSMHIVKKNSTIFEFLNADGDTIEEFAYWSYSYTKDNKSDLAVSADLYRFRDNQYRYDPVLSGQVERQKRSEILAGAVGPLDESK